MAERARTWQSAYVLLNGYELRGAVSLAALLDVMGEPAAARYDGRRGMNLKDEIVGEVRAARDAYAARFNYDLAEMYKDLKAKERAHCRNIATLQPAKPRPDTPVSN